MKMQLCSISISIMVSALQIHMAVGSVYENGREYSNNLQHFDGSTEEMIYQKWREEVQQQSSREGRNMHANDSINIGDDDRDPKFISLFTLIQFENKGCNGTNGDAGVCYTSSECSNLGGSNIGSCAFGYGVCCYFEVTCGGTTSQNCTYIVSPNYPGTYSDQTTCSISVEKTSDTCQIRMDFSAFSMAQPDATTGKCDTDYFQVDKDRKFLHLCGETPSNWHFYLDVNQKSNPIGFSFTSTTSTTARKFKIKLTFVPCSLRVPAGCGQYFTTNTGDIQTFNYGSGTYIAGHNYAICIRKNKGKCRTTVDRTGNSYISCFSDMYRQPMGVPPPASPAGLTNFQPYCQPPAPGINLLSTYTTPGFGPPNLYLYTQYDALSNVSPDGYSGVSQSFTQLDC